MRSFQRTERIVEGNLLAEIDIQLFDDEPPGSGWGPYYSAAEIRKLELIRAALRAGDVAEAVKHARIFRLTPVSAA